MRILAIAALTLAFGAGSAFAECNWTATATASAAKSGTVVAKSEQTEGAATAASSQPVKKVESKG